MLPMLHNPVIILCTGLLLCMVLGYILGEIICHFVKWQVLLHRANRGDTVVDVEAGVLSEAEIERLREARKERLREGIRKVSVLPIVTYKTEDHTTRSAECAICLDDFEDDDVCRVVTGCNHAFHSQCVDAWLAKQQRCPICRHDI